MANELLGAPVYAKELIGVNVPHNPETRRAALTEVANLVRPSAVAEL